MIPPVQLILVPKGVEYQAVCRGLRDVPHAPNVLPVPVGPNSIHQHLKKLQQEGYFSKQPNVLIMGLCGSLTPQLRAGNVALYSDCVYHPTSHPSPLTFDSSLTSAIQEKLGEQATCVKALTTDRVICSAVEKRSLASYAEVVDMEGYAALEFLKALGISVASLRVVSDGCQHDLPDLSKAISPDGVLQPYALTSCMIRRPIAAARLIYGSLIGLSVLQKLTTAVMFGTIDENYFRLK